jgi:predicted CopG family antitoxin
MGTKTLSVDEEAYARLVEAKLNVKESFSKVIKRAQWKKGPKRAANFLQRVSGHLGEEELYPLDQAQEADLPPEDSWTE